MSDISSSIFHERWQAFKNRLHFGEQELPDGSVIINGVLLSPNVLYELRRLGIALSNYNMGELRTAVLACIFDRKLIDDPDGINFFDRINLLPGENRKIDDCDVPRLSFHLHRAHTQQHNRDEYKRAFCHA